MKEIKIGDVIECGGVKVEVGEILHQDYWNGYGWDVEFKDKNGNYRHWKQEYDGGKLIPKDLINKCWDLWADEENPFCPCCIYGNEENCNKCFGLDFHEEFVDLEKAEHLFEDNTTVYVVYSDNGEEYGRYGYEQEAEYHASCIGGYVEEL